MLISIDASGLGAAKTGTAVYLGEILKCWANHSGDNNKYIVFATKRGRNHLDCLHAAPTFSFVDAPEGRGARILWQQFALPRLLRQMRVDVHWGAGFVIPIFSSVPSVVTIFDLTFQILPEVHERVKRIYFPIMIRASVARASRILTISESAAADCERLYPCATGKITVTLLAPRKWQHQPSPVNVGDTWNKGLRFLFVGTLEPRKNLTRLLDAWSAIDAEERRDAQLIIVGATGWMIKDALERSGAIDSVHLMGSLSDEDLADQYTKADVFVYPSLYEGFGLPVVEAMAIGLPVLTSNVGATKEVAADAALLVDPYSADSICDGLIRLLSDDELRRQLSVKGTERAAEFSWDRAAAETLKVLQAAAAGDCCSA
jgi:glycosyltransferase involved in cell wall biosynthesis